MLILSITLEAAVAVLAILAARKRTPYLYGLAFTFAIYVLYDLARLINSRRAGFSRPGTARGNRPGTSVGAGFSRPV